MPGGERGPATSGEPVPRGQRAASGDAPHAGAGDAADARDIDANDAAAETGPLRRCVVTRERLPKERMFRFVVSPDRVLVPDLAGRLPGRGIWLSAARDVVESGQGTHPRQPAAGGLPAKSRELVRAIARAARGPVQVPPDLPGVLEAALIRRIGDLLGLARRAGQAVAGFEKARDWMRTHPVGLILQAADGSAAERMRFRSAVADTVPVLAPLPGAVLGRIMGRETVVHVAVAAGRLADAIIIDAGRLNALRTPSSAAPDPEVASLTAMPATAGANHELSITERA